MHHNRPALIAALILTTLSLWGCDSGARYPNDVVFEGLPGCAYDAGSLKHPILVRIQGEETDISDIYTGTADPSTKRPRKPKVGYYRPGTYTLTVTLCPLPKNPNHYDGAECANAAPVYTTTLDLEHHNTPDFGPYMTIPVNLPKDKQPQGWGACTAGNMGHIKLPEGH